MLFENEIFFLKKMNNVLQEIVYIIVGNEPNYPEGGGFVSVAICQRQDDKE
jgi:hypothetical protein